MSNQVNDSILDFLREQFVELGGSIHQLYENNDIPSMSVGEVISLLENEIKVLRTSQQEKK